MCIYLRINNQIRMIGNYTEHMEGFKHQKAQQEFSIPKSEIMEPQVNCTNKIWILTNAASLSQNDEMKHLPSKTVEMESSNYNNHTHVNDNIDSSSQNIFHQNPLFCDEQLTPNGILINQQPMYSYNRITDFHNHSTSFNRTSHIDYDDETLKPCLPSRRLTPISNNSSNVNRPTQNNSITKHFGNTIVSSHTKIYPDNNENRDKKLKSDVPVSNSISPLTVLDYDKQSLQINDTASILNEGLMLYNHPQPHSRDQYQQTSKFKNETVIKVSSVQQHIDIDTSQYKASNEKKIQNINSRQNRNCPIKKRKLDSDNDNILSYDTGLLDLLCSVSMYYESSIEIGCKCSKTNCLKLYCECFQSSKICLPSCSCVDCFNTEEESRPGGRRSIVMNEILKRRPDAFQRRIKKSDYGCACKKNK